MGATSKSALPEWASHALNGGSYRKPQLWKPEPGDTIAGEVVEVREVTVGNSSCSQLVVRVVGGSQSREPLEPGAWRQINCTGTVLRRWIDKEAPQPGERIALECRSRNGRWFEFVAGIHRDSASW